jgi:UDP-glucose 4-epimerase
MSKILVTGGAGFIASHVVDAYIQHGHEVVILDNLSTGQRKYLNPQAQFIEADITNADQMKSIMQSVRPQVLNLHAAHIQVGYSVENPQFDATNNILGLLNIMEAARQVGGVEKVIMASTGGAMYGNQPVPFVETMPALPLSPYGISKRSGELYLNYYYTLYHIPYIVLRYSNVYGPRQNPHGESGVIAIFMEKIHQGEVPKINGDGTHTRDYVYVADVAQANVLALQSGEVGEFNIGTGTEYSTNDVFRAVVKEMGVTIPEEHTNARPGEQVRSSLDAHKAQQVLGWQPTVDFATGVRLTAEYYKTNH